jgi:hypothetical protein
MPANTLNDMILGYAIILGILLIYILTIIIRTRKARHQQENKPQD